MNNVKLLHIKCCFFQFFNSPVALKNKKNFWPPQEKVEMTPLFTILLFVYLKLDNRIISINIIIILCSFAIVDVLNFWQYTILKEYLILLPYIILFLYTGAL